MCFTTGVVIHASGDLGPATAKTVASGRLLSDGRHRGAPSAAASSVPWWLEIGPAVGFEVFDSSDEGDIRLKRLIS